MIYYWANEFLNVGVLTYPEERRPRPGASDSEDNQWHCGESETQKAEFWSIEQKEDPHNMSSPTHHHSAFD